MGHQKARTHTHHLQYAFLPLHATESYTLGLLSKMQKNLDK